MIEPVEGPSTANGYVFGYSERELERLATQARVIPRDHDDCSVEE